MPGSGEIGDRSRTAHRGGTWNRGGTRRSGSAGTSRTGRAAGWSCGGGEGGIRTHEVFRLSAFQERRHQPLGHLSAAEDTGDVKGRGRSWSSLGKRRHVVEGSIPGSSVAGRRLGGDGRFPRPPLLAPRCHGVAWDSTGATSPRRRSPRAPCTAVAPRARSPSHPVAGTSQGSPPPFAPTRARNH